MSNFEQDVIERLTRLESTIDNGLRADIAAVKKWIEPRPRVCPLVERQNILYRPVAVAVVTAAAMKLFEWGPSIIAAMKGTP